MGAVYRIPLYSILGEEGMGLFQAAYPIYGIMLALSTAGIPVAVSKIVAEKLAQGNRLGARQVMHVSLMLMLCSGLLVAMVLLIGSKWYSEVVIKAPGVFYSLVAIAPAILFTTLYSGFRGYFQGHQSMGPTAISQIIEQLVRVVTIFVLAGILVKYSLELGAAGAAAGTLTGALVALLYLYFYYRRKSPSLLKQEVNAANNRSESIMCLAKQIVMLAVPITIASLIHPMANMIDALLIIPRLQGAGFSEAQAIGMFGNLTGAVMPLIGVPSLFTVALGTALVPAISDAYTLQNYGKVKALSNVVSRFGLMLGLPAACGLFILARPISIMLYYNSAVAQPLAFASLIVVFLTLTQVTTPVLVGLGKAKLPVIHSIIGLALKTIITFWMTSIASINIMGAVIGTIVFFAIITGLNVRAIVKSIGWSGSMADILGKPLLNTLIMAGSIILTSYLISNFVELTSERALATVNVIASMCVGLGVYGIATLLTRAVKKYEIDLIPVVGHKLYRILSKIGIS